MPAPHAFYSKVLAERTASRNIFVLFVLFYFILVWGVFGWVYTDARGISVTTHGNVVVWIGWAEGFY
jgi:hypothetical protein